MKLLDPPYSRYARIYDAIGQNAVGAALANATIARLTELSVDIDSVIDIACGTGAATCQLSKSGFKVVGLDRSAEMLGEAMTRHAALSSTKWVQADMRCQPFRNEFHLATSFFDAVNYLLDDADLMAFFRSTHASLVQDSWFVFDVNTRRRLAEGWADGCFVAVDRPDLFGVYRSYFDAETNLSPLIVTFFERTADTWLRFDEEHIERAFNLTQIDEALSRSGFSVYEVTAFDDRSESFCGQGTEASYRVVFFCRKDLVSDNLSEKGHGS